MKRLLKWTLLLAVIGGIGFGIYEFLLKTKVEQPSRGRQVEAEVVTRDFVSTVLATGTVKPRVGAQVNVGARVSGKVEKLNAAIGDSVKKGDVLAMIEHQDLMAQVTQREAQVASVRTQIESERSKLVASLARGEALVEQRKAELETQRKNLIAIQAQRTIEFQTERSRLAATGAQRKKELAVTSAEVPERTAAKDFAKKDVKRMKTLFDKGMLPEQTLDKAQTDLQYANSKMDSILRQKDLARSRLEQDVAIQEEVLRRAESLLTNDVSVQEEKVRMAETALVVSDKDLEALRATSEAAVANLEARLPELESALEETRIRLSYATVRAPIDGVVGTISTQEGETVAAGFNAPTFVTVVNLAHLQVDAYVDEVDIGKMQPGQPAAFAVDAFPNTEFKGKVTAVYPSAILQDNVVYYDVVIDIETEYVGKLRPEMTANVTIEAASARDVPAIPARALQRRAGANLVSVMVDGEVSPREVEIGLEDGEFVQILSGLNSGETVVYRESVSPGEKRE